MYISYCFMAGVSLQVTQTAVGGITVTWPYLNLNVSCAENNFKIVRDQ